MQYYVILLKKTLFPFYHAFRIYFCQLKIRGLLNRHSVGLVPQLPDNGNLRQYYHFIFDLLLPMSYLVNNNGTKNDIFIIADMGFQRTFNDLMGSELSFSIVESEEEIESEISIQDLWGMNPVVTYFKFYSFEPLRKIVFQKFQIQLEELPTKILLIERVVPNMTLTERIDETSGSYRRSIVNHQSLLEAIRKKFPEEQLINVQLENLTFQQQVELFHSAKLVIAQHGAGLANLIWMKKGSAVVEFGYKNRDHFVKICKKMQLRHHLLRYDERHIHVDIPRVLKIIREQLP